MVIHDPLELYGSSKKNKTAMSQAYWRNGAGKMCLIAILASIEDKGIEIHLLVVRLLEPRVFNMQGKCPYH